MSLQNRQLPSFNGVPATLAAGAIATVTCRLNLGERLHVLWLEFSSADVASNVGIGTLAAPTLVSNIRFKINGKTVREATAQEINRIQSDMGAFYAAKTSGTSGNITTAPFKTRLPWFFAEPWRKGSVAIGGVQIPEAALSAVNLNGIESATIEVDIAGTVAGVATAVTAPSVSGYYEYEKTTANIGQVVKWSRQSFGPTNSPAEIATLDKLRGAYQSIHLFCPSGGQFVRAVKFTRNNEEIRQDIDRHQNDAMLVAREMSPVTLNVADVASRVNTGMYNLMFDYDDPIRQALQTSADGRPVNELTLRPSFGDALTFANVAPSGTMIVISQITGDLE